jgi:tRNA G26 N,N-dimethylase Trm1
MFKIKIDSKTELNINEEKKDKDYYFHVYFNLIKINNEITLGKENEENIITVNNNNKRTKNEMKGKKFFQCCSSCLECFGVICPVYVISLLNTGKTIVNAV